MLAELRQVLNKGDIQKRAIVLAVVVGTVLNCINQGMDVMHGQTIHWTKALLTYIVPYCVSVYSSVAVLRDTK